MVCFRMTSILALVLATASLGFSCQNPAEGDKPDGTSGASAKTVAPVDQSAAFATGNTLEDFQAAAAHHGVVLELPRLDWSAKAIGPEVDRILAEAEVGLNAIANQDSLYVTFDSSFAALDDVMDPVVSILNQLWL